jgi:hypothetical protein
MTPEKILEMLPKKITTYVLNVDGIMLREDCLENRIRNATIDDCANALAGKVVAKEDLLTSDEILLAISIAKDEWYREHSHDTHASHNFVAKQIVEAQQRKANSED